MVIRIIFVFLNNALQKTNKIDIFINYLPSYFVLTIYILVLILFKIKFNYKLQIIANMFQCIYLAIVVSVT